jgi:hypothetical protein
MQSVIYYVRAVCINKKHMQHKVHLRFVGHTRLDIKEKDLAVAHLNDAVAHSNDAVARFGDAVAHLNDAKVKPKKQDGHAKKCKARVAQYNALVTRCLRQFY